MLVGILRKIVFFNLHSCFLQICILCGKHVCKMASGKWQLSKMTVMSKTHDARPLCKLPVVNGS